ncbi:MAG: UDP-N-acetylmuramate dehydrogenase [Actinobacteria bacterium]|nr:UDP-N-acetylmuramate dehydrogenase [Actinomycetota bacterium]
MTHQVPPLSAFTTLRIGGPPQALIAVDSLGQALQTLADLDESGTAYAPLGGGSNLVVSDDGVPFTVVWLRHQGTTVLEEVEGSVRVRVDAGLNWDEFVASCVTRGWSGVESLSGIPGSAGATPIQNVGAYGHDVSETIAAVHAWDRDARCVRELSREDCEFGYRDSMFKRTRRSDGTPRFVVLQVDFTLAKSDQSAPLLYAELAAALGAERGATAPLADVRDAVLALRRSKGMVLDAQDHDTWSVGSFFVNPVVSADVADALPADAPRWPVAKHEGRVRNSSSSSIPEPGQASAEDVGAEAARTDRWPTPSVREFKLSAAWLIASSGFPAGFALPSSAAGLSHKHTLAITNRGDATAVQVLALARQIQGGVRSTFGIQLELEPVLWGTC